MGEIKVIVDDEGHDVDVVFEENIEVGGGGDIVKEIVVVDIMTMIATQNNTSFVDLSKRYINGEIAIIGNAIGRHIIVSNIECTGEDEYAWTAILSNWVMGENQELSYADIAIFGIENKNGVLSLGSRPIPVSEILTIDGIRNLPNYFTLTDGEMAKWREMINAVGTSALEDYVKFTDYASNTKAGVVKGDATKGTVIKDDGTIELYQASLVDIDGKKNLYQPITPFRLDYAWKVSATTNTETWTDDEMQSARDLIGAVGKNDKPTATQAGPIKYEPNVYGIYLTADSLIKIAPAQKEQIFAKSNTYMPITPKWLDYAVLSALADCKDTTLWTDDTTVDGQVVKGTKTKALELLGAIKNEKPKQQNFGDGYILCFDGSGKLSYKEMHGVYIGKYGVPYRDANGVIHGNKPTTPTGLTPKDYVDNLPDNLTLTDAEKAKWCGMIGATKLYLHSMTDKNGKTITLIDSSSVEKTPLEMIEAFHANNCINRNYAGNLIIYTTLLTAGVSAIQIEYIVYANGSVSTATVTLDLTNSTDTVTEL